VTDHVTALHIALHEQNWEIADLLLENGAEVNAENDEGVTPLHIAVAGTKTKIKYLNYPHFMDLTNYCHFRTKYQHGEKVTGNESQSE